MTQKAGRLFSQLILLISLLVFECCEEKPPENTMAEPYTCSGGPVECLRIQTGWTYEGRLLDYKFSDHCVIRLADGRYWLIAGVPVDEPNRIVGVESYVSSDGLSFQKEAGYRITNKGLFMPCVLRTKEESIRLYYVDQTQGPPSNKGYKAVKSAISTDGGVNFTVENGERLTYLSTGYEVDGIRQARVLFLPDGRYRMYYQGISDYSRILSAVSVDGLNWTREDGIRVDPKAVCPAADGFAGNFPMIDAAGTYHLFLQAVRCTGNYENARAGTFDALSTDGLNFVVGATPIVEGYLKADTYHGNVSDPGVDPEDLSPLQTPNGIRIYFALYDKGKVIPESGIYSVLNTSIR
jgi:hypothetical protein